jgi:hypothetical protein
MVGKQPYDFDYTVGGRDWLLIKKRTVFVEFLQKRCVSLTNIPY